MKKIDIVILLVLLLAPIGVGFFQMQKQGDSNIFSQFQKRIAVINIDGVIMSEDGVLTQIEKITKDKSFVGLILRINSPGGAVAPSQEIYQGVLKYRQATGNPVYVSMGTVAASGGYYIASAGDCIYANSGTLTGSIGVIMQFSHYHGLMKKIGVDISTITAGKLKDAGSPYRTLTAEDSSYFNDLLKDTHEQFIKDVASARKMDIKKLRQYAEGQIFTGNMAKKFGLIDSIGTYDQCCESIKKDFNLPESTEFVSISDEDASPFSELFESKTPVKQIMGRLFPRSGVYFLAEELQ